MNLSKFVIFILLIFITSSCFAAAENEHNGKLGFGYGIPYGGFGTNLEISVGNIFALTFGAGGMYSHLSVVGGIKAYLLSPKSSFRPRISFYTGYVGMKEAHEMVSFNEPRIDGLMGEAIAIGFEKQLNEKLSLDFDIVKAFYNLPENTVVKGSIPKVALGICFYFNDTRAKK
jgi:hypothetical protein